MPAIKRFLRKIGNRYPLVGSFVFWIHGMHQYQIYRYYLWHNRVVKNGTSGKDIIFVPPNDIRSVLRDSEKVPMMIWRQMGVVQDGDWDSLITPFEGLRSYRAIYHRFINHGNWEETEYWRESAEAITRGSDRWGCSSINELRQRCANLDELYSIIKKHGYKSQKMLLNDTGLGSSLMTHIRFRESQKIQDEIVVNLSRSGEPIFVMGGGQHRLSIAKVLNVPLIPVRILVRRDSL
jgi:hypothetical protein